MCIKHEKVRCVPLDVPVRKCLNFINQKQRRKAPVRVSTGDEIGSGRVQGKIWAK